MSTATDSTPDLRTSDYDQMLAELDRAIDELTDKIENGRIRDPERDKTRVKQYRALGYLIRTKQQVLEDVTLQELEAEIEQLKAGGEV
jgi:transcription initiation factor IIE alpha subunit